MPVPDTSSARNDQPLVVFGWPAARKARSQVTPPTSAFSNHAGVQSVVCWIIVLTLTHDFSCTIINLCKREGAVRCLVSLPRPFIINLELGLEGRYLVLGSAILRSCRFTSMRHRYIAALALTHRSPPLGLTKPLTIRQTMCTEYFSRSMSLRSLQDSRGSVTTDMRRQVKLPASLSSCPIRIKPPCQC